jgi:putative ABC transport system permease protein
MGAEIAGLGIIFGIGMGFLMGTLMRPALSSMQPLPIWKTPFQIGPFAAAASIGFLLPFLATAWPVWRAVRVEPVQAIQTGHLASKGGGLAPVFKRFHLPGRSLAQMPLRNVLRAPRRTILTALGIGAAIVLLVVILGSLDSFDGILNRVSSEMNRGAPDRIAVILANFQPQNSDLIRTIQANPTVGMAEPVMIGTAQISNGDKQLDMMLQAQDMSSPVWHPTINSPADPGGLPGIVLPEKAASDLGIKPGDTLTMTHPYRTGGTTFAFKQSEVRLVGLSPMPVRIMAYMDLSSATGLIGLEGFTNGLQITPAAGQTVYDVKQAIFSLPGVASIQAPSSMLELARDKIRQFSGIFNIIAAFIFLLALLIAFSAASISADEHRREHATMQAYGVRVRSLLRMAVVESGVVGIMGSLVGIGLGFLALGWLLGRMTTVMPDIQVKETVTGATILITFIIGIVATAIAPLFNARKLRKMDVPSTLRVME